MPRVHTLALLAALTSGCDSAPIAVDAPPPDVASQSKMYCGCKVVVTLRKAFGFGSSVMGMNPWDRQAISLALPSANLGGVPAIGGAEAARASSEDAAHMGEVQSSAWVPADAMAFDKVVSPADLRHEIGSVVHPATLE